MKYLLALAILAPAISNAGVSCTEKVSKVILHKNSNVYFTTSVTCPNWCQMKWAGEGDKDRAYSTLLAARATDKPMHFYWENINSCSEINVTYESPGYFEF